MPVIPESSDFPSAPEKGSNEAEKKPEKQTQKATAADFLSKGPQIPDNMPPKASKEELEARAKELNESSN
ncbi:hypothetical protein DTO013E5_4491 [Penicillium roqueforti]|uniref:Genomic scaffold, ProqFM164S01 n=1 Tax=Penicillium roqueforti (strain FM164) TaxID=1365484 RepID=W6PU60_PENRF|nr:uncharacterized protein LCP9604111_4377 [Penicillium roqueforti]XP_057040682.1 uncharacterized protein N7518_008052 [Penicillium psychrosexuale]CDM27286.1 unnamed protein product [Penicillium roqueforti FM164]KAF9249221.1 hypothetical protein LCP9604111_4377 [Penicillium roqueforti]KAI1834267.1 hypothetical protein CBS147337_5231 [Penicillium roqueforti]KAI2675057.1 hypothetical protein CBS147355_6871 [Penicillium roqueforti]KAI2688315.1 hypothetical protein LCP963914a_2717 [Penicillium ro